MIIAPIGGLEKPTVLVVKEYGQEQIKMNHQIEFVRMDKNRQLREALIDVLVVLHARERTSWQKCEQPVCTKARLALKITPSNDQPKET